MNDDGTFPDVETFDWRNDSTLKEETFAGRNFRFFAIFGLFRESSFREILQDLSTAKVYSRKSF